MTEDIIYGIHPVREAIDAGRPVEKLLIRQDMAPERMGEWRRLAKEIDIPMQMVPEIKLRKLSNNGNHQGVVAMLSAAAYHDLETTLLRLQEEGKTPMLVMLDGVTDVRNFGAIARSAECLGAQAVILPSTGAATLSSDAVRASAGALHHLPVVRVQDLVDAVLIMQAYGIRTVGLSEKGQATLWEVDLKVPTCLAMGSEEKGLSPRLLRRVEELVNIPLKGQVGSLNVSVAAGIALAEAARQRG